jgi:hypothetical protein
MNMMKNKNATRLLDEYLEALQGMEPPQTDQFFYTRLRARMEKKVSGWSFPLRPVWVIAMLLLFISINSVLLFRQQADKKEMGNNAGSLNKVAETYNLAVSSSY